MLRRLGKVALVAFVLGALALTSAPGVFASGGFDLAVSVSGPTRVKSTQNAAFTVTVRNLGPDTATGNMIGAGIGPGLFRTVSVTCNDANGSQNVAFCEMAALAPGASMTATMVLNACCLTQHKDRHTSVAAEVLPVDGNYDAWNELNASNDWVPYDIFVSGKPAR